MTLLIGISGGSGSGKSTLAEALAEAVDRALGPGSTLVMREDWYYRDAAALPDFDAAAAVGEVAQPPAEIESPAEVEPVV